MVCNRGSDRGSIRFCPSCGQVSGASFLNRIRLNAAPASSSCCWIFHWPTCFRLSSPAMVLNQLKLSCGGVGSVGSRSRRGGPACGRGLHGQLVDEVGRSRDRVSHREWRCAVRSGVTPVSAGTHRCRSPCQIATEVLQRPVRAQSKSPPAQPPTRLPGSARTRGLTQLRFALGDG